MTEQKNDPWRPQVEPDTYPSLEEIVAQAIGSGSVCWSSTPNGIFMSERAEWITNGAAAAIRKLYDFEDHMDATTLPNEVRRKWEGCSRAEAIRQCEANHATVIEYAHTIDNLQGQVRALRTEIANQDVVNPWASAADAPSEGDGASDVAAQLDGARDDDKIHVLRTLLDSTSAQGTDMANFIRRIRLILGA